MAKYNIYKLIKEKEESFFAKIKSVGLLGTATKQVGEFTLSLYVSVNPADTDIGWTKLYKNYLQKTAEPKNKSYFAVFVLSNQNLLYAVSMGKAHFYLKEYCDTDFGINLAERIADKDHLRLKNTKFFGGKKNKTIVSYQHNAAFEYDSGESFQFVRAKTINFEVWGKEASFGNSVQFNLKLEPDELPTFIEQIENTLGQPSLIALPRASAVVSEVKNFELDKKLVDAIVGPAAPDVQAQEAVVSGVEFIFNNKNEYRFIYKGGSYDVDGELDVQSLKSFLQDESINLAEALNDIKVGVSDEDGKGYTKSLKYFLDYVGDDRYFLLDGKWHLFNQNYIEFLKKHVDSRIVFESPDVNLSEAEFVKWKDSLSDDKKKVSYREFYFNQKQEADGYLNYDRHISSLQGYKIEKFDLYKDETIVFVKIGTPQSLGYVIDQAITTIKTLQNLATTVDIDGVRIHPKKVCLWLLLDRKQKINKVSDIESLIFLIKLNEWERHCANAGYQAVVRVGYLTN